MSLFLFWGCHLLSVTLNNKDLGFKIKTMSWKSLKHSKDPTETSESGITLTHQLPVAATTNQNQAFCLDVMRQESVSSRARRVGTIQTTWISVLFLREFNLLSSAVNLHSTVCLLLCMYVWLHTSLLPPRRVFACVISVCIIIAAVNRSHCEAFALLIQTSLPGGTIDRGSAGRTIAFYLHRSVCSRLSLCIAVESF